MNIIEVIISKKYFKILNILVCEMGMSVIVAIVRQDSCQLILLLVKNDAPVTQLRWRSFYVFRTHNSDTRDPILMKLSGCILTFYLCNIKFSTSGSGVPEIT